MNEGTVATRLGIRGIPNAAESIMVMREIALAELTNARVHIAHVSCEESVAAIRQGKKRGIKVTCETAPHYFTLTDEAVADYDTHAKIPAYFASVDAPARDNNTTAVISTGWDPGLFSLNRMMGEAILPEGVTYTFWGRGLSQGHSDAVRRVPGVAGGVQYTIPSPEAVERARSGDRPKLSTREKHTRHCYVVLADGAEADAVEQAIVTMPDYFADYDTTVTFIDADTLATEHDAMPHGGFVIRSASSADGRNHTMQFSLELGHNPAFTASVLVAYARAAYRMNQAGDVGAKTLFDVAPGLLSPRSPEDLRRDLL